MSSTSRKWVSSEPELPPKGSERGSRNSKDVSEFRDLFALTFRIPACTNSPEYLYGARICCFNVFTISNPDGSWADFDGSTMELVDQADLKSAGFCTTCTGLSPVPATSR